MAIDGSPGEPAAQAHQRAARERAVRHENVPDGVETTKDDYSVWVSGKQAALCAARGVLCQDAGQPSAQTPSGCRNTAPSSQCPARKENLRAMRLLVHVDGSPWASLALQHAARRLEPGDEVVLLAVCPRDSEGYLECGRMVLEVAQRASAGVLAAIQVRTRLAVGDAGRVVPALAAEEQANLVVMGPPNTNEAGTHARGYFFPRERDTVTRPIESLSPGDLRRAMSGRCECPILTGSPRGIELLVGNEAVLVSTRREAALSSTRDGFEAPRLRP
jgi:hypothetical protein